MKTNASGLLFSALSLIGCGSDVDAVEDTLLTEKQSAATRIVWGIEEIRASGEGCSGVSALAAGLQLSIQFPALALDLEETNDGLSASIRCEVAVPFAVVGPVKQARLVERLNYNMRKTRDAVAAIELASQFGGRPNELLQLRWPNFLPDEIVSQGATQRTELRGLYRSQCAYCDSDRSFKAIYRATIRLSGERGNASITSLSSRVNALDVAYEILDSWPVSCGCRAPQRSGDDDDDDDDE